MKKFYFYMMTLCMIATTSLMLSSCDEDLYDAMEISGEWEGDMGMFVNDGKYEYDAINTYMAFYPDYEYAKHGYGEQIDYYARPCPVHHQNFFFEWDVVNGVLYITYPYNESLNVALGDYRFKYRRGRRCMDFSIGGVFHRLYKLTDYYYDDYYAESDWYWWHDGAIYNDSYYYYSTPWSYYGKQRDNNVGEGGSQTEKVNLDNITTGRDFSRMKPFDK